MLDRIETEMWVNHHHAFGHWVAERLADTAAAFRVLARLQYDAPWQRVGPRRGSGAGQRCSPAQIVR